MPELLCNIENTPNTKKLYLLIFIRCVLVLTCLCAIWIEEGRWNFSSAAWYLLVFWFTSNIVALFLCRHVVKFYFIFVIVQFCMDLLVETALIYLTGGMFSLFTSLYFIFIVLSSIFISPHSSYISASLATIGISGIAFTYFVAALDDIVLPFIAERAIYTSIIVREFAFCKAYLFAQAVAFYSVAFLSSRLAITLFRERILQEEIFQNLTDGVIVFDAQQNLVFINNNAKKILELGDSLNWVGKAATQFLHVEKHKDILKTLKSQRALAFETQIPCKESMVPIFLNASTIMAGNRVRAVIIILRDMTVQKRMEQALERASRLTILSETAATIAHEIRNPLASIRGAIQEIQNLIPPEDPRYILMSISIRESDRIDRIITEFLEFSRIRMPVFQTCNVSLILEEVLMLIQRRRGMEQSSLIAEIEPKLIIKADPEQLKQIFYNLSINGIEASPDKISLTVIANRKILSAFTVSPPAGMMALDAGVEICFRDKGVGIPPELLSKLGTPFFTTKLHGTGMGLAFVGKVLEFHGGLYSISSEVGEGTTFRIWLPEDSDTYTKMGVTRR